MKKLLLYLLAILPIGLSFSTHSNKNMPLHTKTTNKEQPIITIWIHGTRLLRHYMFASYYHRKIGLYRACTYRKKCHLKEIAKNISHNENDRFDFNSLYFFGWSGRLSHTARKNAAKKLHESLLKIKKQYIKKYNISPQFRIVTHSHGGNLALICAKINDKSTKKITVAELILLACPVQQKTSHLIGSQTLKKIYSIYSASDTTQIIDPQGLMHLKKLIKKEITLFSERTFLPQDNLTQVQITIDNKGIDHNDFLNDFFTKGFSNLLKKIDNLVATEKQSSNTIKQIQHLNISTANTNSISQYKKRFAIACKKLRLSCKRFKDFLSCKLFTPLFSMITHGKMMRIIAQGNK